MRLAGPIALLVTLAAAAVSPAAADPLALADDFEAEVLDRRIWSEYRMPPRHVWITENTPREGAGSLLIRVKGNDYDRDCQCQRSELRETPEVRIPFGTEAWYAFSFRIRGEGALAGSPRWIIAAWKQEGGDASPFLAQRFDNGIFHITLESGATRVLLASSAASGVEGLMSVLNGTVGGPFAYLSDKETYSGRSDIKLAYEGDGRLPDPRDGWVDMVYRVRGGLDGSGAVEVHANGRHIVTATGTIGVEVPGATGTQYFRLGHNRAAMPGTATLFVDRFRRASTRAGLMLADD